MKNHKFLDRLLALVFFIILVVPAPALAATYYVSISGNDANDGSLAAPFRTISKAMQTFNNGDTVYVGAGTYVSGVSGESENFDIGSQLQNKTSLHLIGTGHDQTFLNFNGGSGVAVHLHNHLVLDSSITTIEGFTFNNFWNECFSIRKSANMYFKNNRFVGFMGDSSNVVAIGAELYAGPEPRNCWNLHVTNNTFESCGVIISATQVGEISNNSFFGNRLGRDGIMLGWSDTNITVDKNTVVGYTQQGIDFSDFGGGGTGDTIIVKNNIVSHCQQGLKTAGGWTNVTWSNNIFWKNTQASVDPTTSTAITETSNPRLVNYLSGDLRLYTGSPAISAAAGGGNVGWYQGTPVSPWPGGGNLYVSGSGNDSSGDGSHDNPFRTITRVLDFEPVTIFVGPGTYSTREGETFPLALSAGQRLVGAGTGLATLEGPLPANTSILTVNGSNVAISGLTFKNFYHSPRGDATAALFCGASAVTTVSSCEFDGGTAAGPAAGNNVGVGSFGHLRVQNSLFYDAFIGVAAVNGGTVEARNNVFYNCFDAYVTGNNNGLMPSFAARNSIISGANIALSDFFGSGGAIESTYNCFYNNITNYGTASVAGAGDIYVDPLFVDAAAKNFKLSSSTEGQSITSPCIDAGDPADDYSREPSPNGSRINLGAYGGTALAERSWSATTTTSTSTTTTGTETTTTSTSTITTTTTPINKPVITTDPDSATINLAFNAPTEGAGILKIVEFGPPEREVLTKVVSAVSTGENLVTINQLSNTGEQLKQGPYKWYFEYNGQVSSGKIYIYRLR